MAWSGGAVAAAVTGALFVLLGAYVATLRPRTRMSLYFAGFAVGFGTVFIVVNAMLEAGRHYTDLPWGLLYTAAALAAGIFALAMAGHLIPRAVRLRSFTLAAPLAIVAVAAGGYGWWTATAAELDPAPARMNLGRVLSMAGEFSIAAYLLAAVAIMLAAYARKVPDVAITISLALAMYPAVFTASNAAVHVQGENWELDNVVYYAMFWSQLAVLLVGWIIWSHRRGRGRVAWLAALAIGLPSLLSLLVFVEGAVGIQGSTWAAAGTRVVAILVIAYSILNQQLLGLDLKLKWTVKQSTVAAIFVAAFFVASEAAAAVLGKETGNEYWGIAGAGLLVFAMSPLQRFAQSLTDKALPRVGSGAGDTYRRAVGYTLADGVVTEAEEDHLAELADRLGISAKEALDVQREVRAELGLDG